MGSQGKIISKQKLVFIQGNLMVTKIKEGKEPPSLTNPAQLKTC
jgi:hypothetical protein